MKGRIFIERDFCKGCGYCITACPSGLIHFDTTLNAGGYLPVASVSNGKCNGCGLCSLVCPDAAIDVWFGTNSGKKGDVGRRKL